MIVRRGAASRPEPDPSASERVVDGSWWPSGLSELASVGRATVRSDGAVWLELEDDCWGLVAEGNDLARSYSTVHGRTAGGADACLHGVRFFGGEAVQGGRASIAFGADRLLLGAAVDAESEILLPFVRVAVRGLREWLLNGPRDSPCPLPLRADPQSVRREPEWVRTLACRVDDVELLFIVDHRGSSFNRFKSVYETRAWVQMTADVPISLERWRTEWIDPLRHLVLFGTREQAIVTSLSGDDRSGAERLKVFGRPEVTIAAPAHHPYHQRDRLPAGLWNEDGFGDLITAWFDLHRRLGSIASAAFELLNSSDVPPLTYLLRMTSVMEGYHRVMHDEPPFETPQFDALVATMLEALPPERTIQEHFASRLKFANSQSQRKRLRWLVDRAASADDRLGGHRRDAVANLVDWRNDQTHLGADARPPRHDELLLLNAVLEYVFAANLLIDLGVADDVRYCLAAGYVWDDPVAELDRRKSEQ